MSSTFTSIVRLPNAGKKPDDVGDADWNILRTTGLPKKMRDPRGWVQAASHTALREIE
jgi:hypothetical protein